MGRLLQALGCGLIGSALFYGASLFFGSDDNSAYVASFWGFWIFVVLGWVANRESPATEVSMWGIAKNEIAADQADRPSAAPRPIQVQQPADARIRAFQDRPPEADDLLLADAVDDRNGGAGGDPGPRYIGERTSPQSQVSMRQSSP